jgi:hypothetical protein
MTPGFLRTNPAPCPTKTASSYSGDLSDDVALDIEHIVLVKP